ncbi:MAG TPA: P1 family peptidase [Chloroflexota bacterium]|nr:P1 family peptidase [Chloroflexota bacterium]
MATLPGIHIGHWHDPEGLTGCTVLLPAAGAMRAGVHVGGGAPGTRETDLLAPTARVPEIHALLLAGGSAFGLDAASGVMRWLHERGRGYDVGVARVPIVPAAVIFDLDLGSPEAHPDADAGYAACEAAGPDEAREGTVGAGYGARVGNMLGPAGRMKGGLGLATSGREGGVVVAALAVVNAAGDVIDHDGSIVAGARRDGSFVGSAALLRESIAGGIAGRPLGNTTLGAVATNARLEKLGLTRLAQQAHDGLALSISPVHTSFDGDTVFALSTGEEQADPDALAALAVDAVARAVRRAVRAAHSVGGVPAVRDVAGA